MSMVKVGCSAPATLVHRCSRGAPSGTPGQGEAAGSASPSLTHHAMVTAVRSGGTGLPQPPHSHHRRGTRMPRNGERASLTGPRRYVPRKLSEECKPSSTA